MNTASKCLETTKYFAETICFLILLPVIGFLLMTKPRRQTQAMGSALFVMGSMLWIIGIIAASCCT